MAGENQLSSLFGDMQATTPAAGSGSTPAAPLPDKKENVLGALETLSGDQTPPENTTNTPPVSNAGGLFGDMPLAEKTTTPPDNSISLPEIVLPVQTVSESVETIVPPVLPEVSESQTLPESTTLPEISISPDAPPVGEKVLPPLESLPVSETVPVVPVAPKEQPQPETVAEKVSEPLKKEENPKLDLYMRADHVYQEMLRIENQEKIRLQLAIRYTLLMFAIFLVFAWIVSNRVIMFGFSEFVWLARIRDALFAVMAGLFSLTIWFGSVSWMRQIFLIALLRTIALVFFVAVIVALYIPLW